MFIILQLFLFYFSMSTKSNSFVWNYFDKQEAESGFATCYMCRKKYKTSGNTTNMRDHLKRVHGIINTNAVSSDEVDETENTSNSPTTKRTRYREPTIKDFLSYNNIYRNNDPHKNELNQYLVDMVALDMQPFSIVSDKGFQNFVNKLDNRYKLPSQNTLKNNLLPQRYEEIKNKLLNTLSGVQFLALTTDCWTSSYSNDSYITVTCHFVDNFKLTSAVLETENLTGRHTAIHLSEYLKVCTFFLRKLGHVVYLYFCFRTSLGTGVWRKKW